MTDLTPSKRYWRVWWRKDSDWQMRSFDTDGKAWEWWHDKRESGHEVRWDYSITYLPPAQETGPHA